MFQIMSLHLRKFITESTAIQVKMACLILEQDLPQIKSLSFYWWNFFQQKTDKLQQDIPHF